MAPHVKRFGKIYKLTLPRLKSGRSKSIGEWYYLWWQALKICDSSWIFWPCIVPLEIFMARKYSMRFFGGFVGSPRNFGGVLTIRSSLSLKTRSIAPWAWTVIRECWRKLIKYPCLAAIFCRTKLYVRCTFIKIVLRFGSSWCSNIISSSTRIFLLWTLMN